MFAPSDSFVNIECESASVSAIKNGYSDSDDVVRIYEFLGKEQKTEISYFCKNISVELSPFEIKTLKISNGGATETDFLEK